MMDNTETLKIIRLNQEAIKRNGKILMKVVNVCEGEINKLKKRIEKLEAIEAKRMY